MGKEAEVKTYGEKSVAKFCVAIDRTGKSVEERITSWMPCEMWSTNVSEFSVLAKGQLLDLEGFLKSESWKDASGVEKNRTIIGIKKATITEKKEKSEEK